MDAARAPGLSSLGPAEEREEKSPARSPRDPAAVAGSRHTLRSRPAAGAAHRQKHASERQQFDLKLSKHLEQVPP